MAGPGPDDTVLIGGGEVGVFAVQPARIAGARVLGTGSAASADFLRELGAEPVTYGDGLTDRVRALAPGGVTLDEIARLIAEGRLRVPIAARFPVEQIRRATELQAGRHVHGKVVVDLERKALASGPSPERVA